MQASAHSSSFPEAAQRSRQLTKGQRGLGPHPSGRRETHSSGPLPRLPTPAEPTNLRKSDDHYQQRQSLQPRGVQTRGKSPATVAAAKHRWPQGPESSNEVTRPHLRQRQGSGKCKLKQRRGRSGKRTQRLVLSIYLHLPENKRPLSFYQLNCQNQAERCSVLQICWQGEQLIKYHEAPQLHVSSPHTKKLHSPRTQT